MARCPDCNKFVPYEMDREPEIEDVQVEGEEVFGSVRVVLACEECGTELKESYQEFQEPFEHECDEALLKEAKEAGTLEPDEDDEEFYQYELEDSYAAFHERQQTHTPKGKTIKNPRYAKRYYGASITVTIKCNRCGESFEHEIITEEQASYFDEC